MTQPLNDANPVCFAQAFAANVERLFDAFSLPELYKQWAWGSLTKEPSAEIDFRVGGSFRAEITGNDGARWAFSGEYLDIVPLERIRHTLVWHADVGYTPGPEEVEVQFEPTEGGTLVTFTHRGVPDADSTNGHLSGWKDTFRTLEKLLV